MNKDYLEGRNIFETRWEIVIKVRNDLNNPKLYKSIEIQRYYTNYYTIIKNTNWSQKEEEFLKYFKLKLNI